MDQAHEEFTADQEKILNHYVSNISGNVFALYNLSEVTKGALFSRYSRSSLGLRSLLLKEFVDDDEIAMDEGRRVGEDDFSKDFIVATKKAMKLYDRILEGYGDDSIGELGGAHLAIEGISMIAAKVIEDCRIGGSPLEKSTRYIYFDQKIHGEYMFYREPILMTSAYRDTYVDTCNMLFETYSELIPRLTAVMQERFPKDPQVSKAAYTPALRAKVLDCLRGLLPASSLTNMGIYGNGRFYEGLIHKLECHNLAEMQDTGCSVLEELSKVIPSFVRRGELTHKSHLSYAQFHETMHEELKLVTAQCSKIDETETKSGVSLISYDSDAVTKVAAALLYGNCDNGLKELEAYCRGTSEENIARIFDAASNAREDRRHKSPRALERAEFTFEVVADFGAYRDLQRHRMLSQERQLLTCNCGYYVPAEIKGSDMEGLYCQALDSAKEVYDAIGGEFPEEAQYIVPMAYNIRWYFHANLRELQWLCELRSMPQGHPNYRYIAQKMAKDICDIFPAFETFFKFVNYEEHNFGRLGQERNIVAKKAKG